MGKKIRKITAKDVAELAKVSTATVSRVLNNTDYPVSEELRTRIYQAAKELGYELTPSVSREKERSYKEIGVIIPSVANPFYSQIIVGIENEARRCGYNILLCNTFHDEEMERKHIESLRRKGVRGIIISSVSAKHDYLKYLQKAGMHIVVFDQEPEDIVCGKVGFNYSRGGMMAVDHLVQKGHKEIAFLTSPLSIRSRRETFEGHKLSLLRHGIEYNPNHTLISKTGQQGPGTDDTLSEYENGRLLGQKFLELSPRPTAICAINDMTAFGIMETLTDNGVSIPEDVSILGFDNVQVSSISHPKLTTIDQPSFETGKMACKILVSSINENEHYSISFEPTLIERNSVRNLL